LSADCRWCDCARPPLRGCSDRRQPEQTRQTLAIGFAVGWHEGPADTTLLLRAMLGVRFASGGAHNTHCPFGRSSHLNSLRADNSPPAGPFGTEFRSDNVALCASPLLHCHAACFPDLALVRARTAPVRRHPSRHPTAPPDQEQPGLPHASHKSHHSLASLENKANAGWPARTQQRAVQVFRSGFFCSAFLSIALTRPLHRGCLVVPSEDYSHGQAPAPRPRFVKGDGQKTHSRAEKKRP